MKNYHLFYDEGDPRAQDVLQWIRTGAIPPPCNLIADSDIPYQDAEPDIGLVVGGDGRMLRSIHEWSLYEKPILGLDRGTRGFLMNPIDSPEVLLGVLDDFDSCEIIPSPLLVADFSVCNGPVLVDSKRQVAFNDIALQADHGSVISGYIEGTSYPRRDFRGSGIIVATAQGSTAFNRSAGGVVLPLGHQITAITTNCSMTLPIRDVVNNQSLVIALNSDGVRGLAVGLFDGRVIKNVRRVVIQPDPTRVVRIAFMPGYNFEQKRYLNFPQ